MIAASKIQAVTFDVGGTLIQPFPSVGHVYAEVGAEHGWKDLSPQKLNRSFASAWRAKKNFQHTRDDWADLVDRTFKEFCDPPPSRTFFPALYQRFAETAAWQIHDDVLEALDALASRDLPLAIISNWDERLRSLLRQFRLDRYFETIIVSCEIGFTKPSPVIFEQAAKKIGVEPAHILHVGDSPEEDIDGARAAGFQAVFIDRLGKSQAAGRIASLRQIEPLI